MNLIKNILKDIQFLNVMTYIQLLYVYNGIERIQFNGNHTTIFIFITLQNIM